MRWCRHQDLFCGGRWGLSHCGHHAFLNKSRCRKSTYPSSHNHHGCGKWLPPIVVTFTIQPFSTSMISYGRGRGSKLDVTNHTYNVLVFPWSLRSIFCGFPFNLDPEVWEPCKAPWRCSTTQMLCSKKCVFRLFLTFWGKGRRLETLEILNTKPLGKVNFCLRTARSSKWLMWRDGTLWLES